MELILTGLAIGAAFTVLVYNLARYLEYYREDNNDSN